MNSSVIFRVIIGITLSVSVAWKIMMVPSTEDAFKESIVAFLHRKHFQVMLDNNFLYDTSRIEANGPSCRLNIATLAPDGSNWNAIEHFSTAEDELFVVFRGRVYQRQPILWTILNYFWSRFLGELGLPRNSTQALAVWADPSCNAKKLPWSELGEI